MGLTAFNRMRREAAAAAQKIAPPVVTNDPGKKESQLNRMNKAELIEYAVTLGLAFLEDKTKQQIINEIQARETALESEK